MTRKPSISIIFPAFNAEPYLRQAISSILEQTFTDFELIVIDDGSTDNTAEIIQSFADKDSRILFISRENKGLVNTLNEGIELAKGEFIARMDADDISLPLRFEKQIAHMMSHPETVCLGTAINVVDGKGRYIFSPKPLTENIELVESALNAVSPIIHPSAMIRTQVLKKIGGYKSCNYPAEDLALWIDLSEYGELRNLPDVLLDYRIHDNSISTQKHELQREKTEEICSAACEKRGLTFNSRFVDGRANESVGSKYEITLRHGWWAHSSRQWHTSAIYALKAIRHRFFDDGGWRLLFCSFFRRS